MTGGTVIGREGRRLGLAMAAGLVAGLWALASGGPARAGTASFDLVDIGNFDSPVHVDDAPGATGHLYVVEQDGTIEVLVNEVQESEPFLDIQDIVASGGEEGLLSVAFHPDYAENRRFYVYYTTNGHDIRIDQFRRRAADPLSAGVGSRRKVIKIDHDQADNHNGGQVQFGPDGYLYAGIGDGGPQGDPENDAQRKRKNLLGKLIRIDPLPQGGYESPPDNPYVGEPGRNEIAALGLRNPWRFSFDSLTGALTIGDVGGGAFEEVDYVADGVGANFGWNDYEGFMETSFGIGANANPRTEPIAVFGHGDGDNFCAIAGGYVVRDPGLPDLAGQYILSDLCQSEIRALQIPSGSDGTDVGVSGSSVVAFGEGEGNQIYVVDLAGDVFRLEQLN
jgi:Glucose / Sorbosone dehydrogenase